MASIARVYIIGNGGSFANAQHIANDFLSVGMPAFTIDPATLTAFANDHGYENAFAIWIGIVGQAGDKLIALSGSGKSPNILNAIGRAEAIGMVVEKWFGRGDMQVAEEEQIKMGHEIMKARK